jgi:hypothetical protein
LFDQEDLVTSIPPLEGLMTDRTLYWPFAHIIVVTVPLVCGSFHLPARPGMAYWPVAGEVVTGVGKG